MRMKMGVLAVVTLTGWVVVSAAQSQTPKPTGMFTDMRWIPEAGDLIGQEVFIVGVSEGYSAVVQVAQGEPSQPLVVPVTVNGTEVRFDFPYGGRTLRFSGRLTATSLIGTFGDEAVTLRRRQSYWQ